MKRIIACLPLAFLFLWGCNANSGGGNPEEVLTQFFKALSEKNIQETKKYVTEDSEGMINLMQMSLKNMGAAEESDQFNPEKVTIGEPEIKGEEAQVPVTEKSTGETVQFFLKKEKGKWKVAFDMATLARMAQQKMEKEGVNAESMEKMLKDLNADSHEFNQHLDSIATQIEGISSEDIRKAKEFIEKNPELIQNDMDKIKEELEKFKKQNP